jgi:hypothetical protein
MASFRETGDGPRGLIDAADKLARALRAKAGESLRSVNATPPLAQATTSSLDALRKYARESAPTDGRQPSRCPHARGNRDRLDLCISVEWLGAMLSNYGGTRSAIDSALAQAYRYRDRLPSRARSGGRSLLRTGAGT